MCKLEISSAHTHRKISSMALRMATYLMRAS